MFMRRFLLAFSVVCSSVFSAEPLELRAGRVTMLFEPDNAFLRHIQVGEHLVLQGISAPVRDRFWGTVPPAVTNLKLERRDNSFDLSFDVSCRQREIDFAWKGQIRGSADGRVTFTFDGQAKSSFLRNRIGFCVLHPAEAAGQPCEVESVSGKTTKGSFPTFISPHQPFMDIRAISHEVAPGVWAVVRMEGDTFEMEDQRNWTDASFKTYCTPLALPFPVQVEKGTKISQRIELSIEGAEKLPNQPTAKGRTVVLRVDKSGTSRPIPRIGLQMSSQTDELTDKEVERLRKLNLGHLRVDVTPADPGAGALLQRGGIQAARLGVPLFVGLHLGPQPAEELGALTKSLAEINPPATWLVIAANDDTMRIARGFLTSVGQKGRIGRGEDTNFTELNRTRPDPKSCDVVSYGMNPQVHAFDNLSIIETLPIQADTVRSARQFLGDVPLLISPVTLKTQKMNQAPAADELPSRVDPRQASPFAAGWTLGSIKYLGEAGVEAITYYETVGWLGVMESEKGSPLPTQFGSRPGQLYPIYHVLHEFADMAGGSLKETKSSDPMAIIGLYAENGNRGKLIIANLTSQQNHVDIEGINVSQMRRLDSDHSAPQDVAEGTKDADDHRARIELPAYGLAVLSVE